MKDLEAITTPSEGPHPKPSLEKILKKKPGNIPKTVVDKSMQYDLACHH
jgi:hypothetical protein